jgi:hypothetical protein
MTITPATRRNICLSLFAMVFVLVVGGFFFHDSEIGSYVVPGVSFFGGLILVNVLDDREWRRQGRRGGTPSS